MVQACRPYPACLIVPLGCEHLLHQLVRLLRPVLSAGHSRIAFYQPHVSKGRPDITTTVITERISRGMVKEYRRAGHEGVAICAMPPGCGVRAASTSLDDCIQQSTYHLRSGQGIV